MKLIAILSVLTAVAVALGLYPAEFAFAGIPMPVYACIIAALAMVYAVTFSAP